MVTRLLFAALLLAATPAMAQVAPAPEPAPSEAVAATAEPAADAATRPIDRHCVRNTGTHIRSRPTPRRRDCGSTGMGRVYSRGDLDRSGHTNIAQALRTLDPSIY